MKPTGQRVLIAAGTAISIAILALGAYTLISEHGGAPDDEAAQITPTAATPSAKPAFRAAATPTPQATPSPTPRSDTPGPTSEAAPEPSREVPPPPWVETRPLHPQEEPPPPTVETLPTVPTEESPPLAATPPSPAPSAISTGGIDDSAPWQPVEPIEPGSITPASDE